MARTSARRPADAELAELRAEFDRLFEASCRRVWAFAVRRTGSRARAEALTRRALEYAFRHLEEIPEDVSSDVWLLGIARREADRRAAPRPDERPARASLASP